MSSDPVPLPTQFVAPDDDRTSRRAAAIRAVAVTALAAVVVPVANVFSLPAIPMCAFKLWTGLACPGCGMTRSMVCLCRGDVAAAFRFHPLGLVLGGAALAVLAGGVGGAVTGRDPFWRFLDRRSATLAIAFVSVLVAVWLARTFVVPSWAPPDVSPELFASR